MKPFPNGMGSPVESKCHLLPALDGCPKKRHSLIGRLARILAALSFFTVSLNIAELAGAGPLNADAQQVEKKTPQKKSPADTVEKNIPFVVTNPRGEALVFETASTAVPLLGLKMWSATLSPDGKIITTAHGSGQSKGELRIWDREAGKVKKTISHEKGVRSVAYSPDGKLLASASFDGGVRFYDSVTFDVFAIGDETSGGHKNAGVNCVRFFKGGKYLASAGLDNTIRLWDVAAIVAAKKASETVRVSPVGIFRGHTQMVLSVAGTEDGRTLLSGSSDKSGRVWDVPDSLPKMGEKPVVVTKERLLLDGHNTGVEGIAISPDGQVLVTSAWGGLLLIRNPDGSRTDLSTQMPGGVMCATFSRDGKYLAVGCGVQDNPRAREVRVWDMTARTVVARRNDFGEGVKGIEFTPDGKTLIVAVADQTVHVWPWGEPTDRQTLNASSNALAVQPFLAAAVSPDGSLLAFSGESQSVFVFKAAEGRMLAELTGHEDVVAGLAFSPDGKTLVTASFDKSIKLWNTQTWKERKSLAGHTGWVFSVAFSPDGQTLASCSYDKTVRLWNVETGEAKATWKDHSGGIRSVAFSPDGKKIVSGGSDRIPRVWDVAEGKVLLTLKGHKNAVRSVAFAPDGKSIASGSEDRSVKIWNAETGKETKAFTDLPDMVTAVCFSPKGQTLTAGTFQGPIAILDPLSGRTRQMLRSHRDSVSTLVFTNGGQRLLSASLDRTIRHWSFANVIAATPLQKLDGKHGIFVAAALAPNGTAAALGNVDGSIAIWNLKEDVLTPYQGSHPGGIAYLDITNTMRIASVGKDGAVLVGTLAGKETWKAKGSFAAFTPNEQQLAIVEDKDVVLYDAATGKEVKRFAGGHEGAVVRCAFSPDGTKMISAGQDTKVRLWDVASGAKGKETAPIGNEAEITHLAFSPEGNRFAFSAHGPDQPPPDDMTGMFRVVREVQVYTVPKPEAAFAKPIVINQQPAFQPLTGLHWSGSGTTLAMVGSDGTVRIMELGKNETKEQQRYQAHDSAVLASAASLEAGVLLTAGEDMAVRRWRIQGLEPAPGQPFPRTIP